MLIYIPENRLEDLEVFKTHSRSIEASRLSLFMGMKEWQAMLFPVMEHTVTVYCFCSPTPSTVGEKKQAYK